MNNLPIEPLKQGDSVQPQVEYIIGKIRLSFAQEGHYASYFLTLAQAKAFADELNATIIEQEFIRLNIPELPQTEPLGLIPKEETKWTTHKLIPTPRCTNCDIWMENIGTITGEIWDGMRTPLPHPVTLWKCPQCGYECQRKVETE